MITIHISSKPQTVFNLDVERNYLLLAFPRLEFFLRLLAALSSAFRLCFPFFLRGIKNEHKSSNFSVYKKEQKNALVKVILGTN